MNRARCRTPDCRRPRMRGADNCFYCARRAAHTPPEITARQIAALLGEREQDDAL